MGQARVEAMLARRLLRFELGLACERSGLSQGVLARVLGVSRVSLSQVVSGKYLPSRESLETLAVCLDVPGRLARWVELEGVARASANRSVEVAAGASGWLVRDGLLAGALERSAGSIDVFDAAVITPLLRSPGYEDELVVVSGGRMSGVRRRVVVTADSLVELSWLVDEHVLRRVVGGVGVMAGQCAHLVEVSRLPNVTVRVVPDRVGVHVGVTGSFQVYRSDFWTVVCQETRRSAHYVTDAGAVADYVAVMADLRRAALDPEQSREFLVDLGSELSTRAEV